MSVYEIVIKTKQKEETRFFPSLLVAIVVVVAIWVICDR